MIPLILMGASAIAGAYATYQATDTSLAGLVFGDEKAEAPEESHNLAYITVALMVGSVGGVILTSKYLNKRRG